MKSIQVSYPAKVAVNKVTGDIYTFSWGIRGVPLEIKKELNYSPTKVEQKITVFSAYPETKKEKEFPYQFGEQNRLGSIFKISFDSWAEESTFWLISKEMLEKSDNNVKCVKLKDGKWETAFSMDEHAEKEIVRVKPTAHNIQQLFFNDFNKKLYIGEPDSGPTRKAWTELIEVDPINGNSRIVSLPINAQDIAFDAEGYIYLRTANVISRFEMNTWKEIPFDYGVEKESVGRDGGIGGVASPVQSAIILPTKGVVCYHQGGMSVNSKGNIAVACGNRYKIMETNAGTYIPEGNYFKPLGYPGRLESSTSVCIHVWNKYGQIIRKDAIKGCPQTDGIAIDDQDNLFILATPGRLIDGKPIDDGMSSTLIKFNSDVEGKFYTSYPKVPIPLTQSISPDRKQELDKFWVDGFSWMYGGGGFAGFNADKAGGGCACWFVRFKIDKFARSFVPEPMQFNVSVLDSEGNLILKIGQYGNEDSKGPKSLEPLGGDEVGLFHPCFVAVDSDKRLFISDIGNEKVMSVLLNYAIEEIIELK